MDSIETEFLGSVRPYFDRPDIVIPVQWYRASPSARWIDCPTAFANVINKVEGDYRPNVGINYDFTPNRPGNAKGFLGLAKCGTNDAFLNGVSWFNPLPPCNCAREKVIPVQEIPAGTIDGTNRTFTLSQIPMSAASLLLEVDGVTQTQGVDYSVSGATIFFAALSTPRSTDTILAYYWVQT